jgi:hypothetical protein
MLRLFRSGRGTGLKRVTIPDLSGLTKTEIETLLDSLGISYSSTASNTENSGLANKHKSQSVAAGTTVLRGSSISFEYYNYTAPPYFPPYFPYFPTFIPAPSFSTTPYLSSKTSSSLTWSWVGENYQSWKLYSGGTGEIFASGDGQATSATRSGLSPSTSYTATIRLYSSTGLSGVSTSDAVSGTTEAAAPTPPDFTPAPPDFTPAPPDFTPAPPDFTPAPPSFPYFKGGKGPGCIYSETRLLTVNNKYIEAKNISVGDKIMAISPAGLLGETIIGANTDIPISLIGVDVVSVEKSVKDVVSFNDLETFYSPEQPIIVDRNGKFNYVRVGEINTGDTIITIDPASNSISNIVVNDIIIKQSVDVYDIRTAPYQWYVVENTLAIS